MSVEMPPLDIAVDRLTTQVAKLLRADSAGKKCKSLVKELPAVVPTMLGHDRCALDRLLAELDNLAARAAKTAKKLRTASELKAAPQAGQPHLTLIASANGG